MASKPAKLKIVEGAVVRLKRDAVTRGGRTFRAGVVMRVDWVSSRSYRLRVVVRAKRHYLELSKSDAWRDVDVLSNPDPETEVVGK